MSFKPYTISNFTKGLVRNKKPFQLMDDAFQLLENAYIWRDRAKKREGIKFIGRLRRVLTSEALDTTVGAQTTYNIADVFSTIGITGEADAQIEPGSLVVTIGAPDNATFTDQGDGTFVVTGVGVLAGSYVNYQTGEINLVISASTGGAAITADFNYFPSLPAMGIDRRELSAVNNEQTIFFDTKYMYTYNGSDFLNPSTTTWAGSDSDFFWMANYRGSDPNNRIFFVTNNTSPITSTDNRIRYTSDAATWTDFTPVLGGTQVTSENDGTVTTPWMTFAGNTTNFPVVPGSVTINLSNATDPSVSYKDDGNGTLTSTPSGNTGTITYSTGAYTLNFSPAFTEDTNVLVTYQYNATSLFQAEIIIPYYGRLLALNTWEGASAGTSTNFFNRCRFSQVGDPLQGNAWVTTVFGKGGFIDAPTNEAIVSARFYKNTLIVQFEKSTWQLRYVGEYGLPFIWERISSDFGAESTFSTILFDSGVLAVGDKAIVVSDGNSVDRIDLDIPDTVFSFKNADNGKKRVHGTRDFQKEIVYWSYPDGGSDSSFPNKVLVYNYRNNTWADFRDSVTCFGTLTNATGDSWDLPISWDEPVSWDTYYPEEFPMIVSGNHQGFVHSYNLLQSLDTNQSNQVELYEQESLFIKGITLSNTDNITLNIPNHNLESGEIIYVQGLQFIDTATSTVVTTTLNDTFYQVVTVTTGGAEDEDNIEIVAFDETSESFDLKTSFNIFGYSPSPAIGATYVGGGVVALLPKMRIITKDFNPLEKEGWQIKSSYTDFQTDATPNSEVSIYQYVNSNLVEASNLPVFDPDLNTSPNQTGRVTGATQANPCRITSPKHGLTESRQITFTNVKGMTELNGNLYTTTFVDNDHFEIDVDSSAFTAYTNSGNWVTQDDNFYYTPGSNYMWHRYYATVFGEYLTYEISYSDTLMNTKTTHNTDFEMNGIRLWLKPSVRGVI